MVERAVLVTDSSTLKLKHFMIPTENSNSDCTFQITTLAEMEKRLITQALILTNYNRVKAAKLLKVDRKIVERRIKKYNISIKKRRQ